MASLELKWSNYEEGSLYEYLEENKSFDVEGQFEEDEEGNEFPIEVEDKENLLYLLALLLNADQKINRDEILEMFKKANFHTHDFVEYSGNVLTITRNPYGFINVEKRNYTHNANTQKKRNGSINTTIKNTKGGADGPFDRYNGVKLDETGNINDENFIRIITQILKLLKSQSQNLKIDLS